MKSHLVQVVLEINHASKDSARALQLAELNLAEDITVVITILRAVIDNCQSNKTFKGNKT